MLQFKGRSYGYGQVLGVTTRAQEGGAPDSRIDVGDAVVVTEPLSAADYCVIVENRHAAFCLLTACTAYSHLAGEIWASGVPALVSEAAHEVPSGRLALADFDEGLLYVAERESDELTLRAQSTVNEQYLDNEPTQYVQSHDRIVVMAEAQTPAEIDVAMQSGASGLGIVKAENLFSGSSPTDRAIQLVAAARKWPGLLPLPIRFYDSEQPSDRPSGFKMRWPKPVLGYRGIRALELDHELLERFLNYTSGLGRDDFIAVLPMVCVAEEVISFRELVEGAISRVGITVETPAAALGIAELLKVADSVEIGLNDLTQYTMAWDRDVPSSTRLPEDRIAPVVAVLVSQVAAACREARVPYVLGLDLRPSTLLVEQLEELKVETVSCAPGLVKRWKRVLSGVRSGLA